MGLYTDFEKAGGSVKFKDIMNLIPRYQLIKIHCKSWESFIKGYFKVKLTDEHKWTHTPELFSLLKQTPAQFIKKLATYFNSQLILEYKCGYDSTLKYWTEWYEEIKKDGPEYYVIDFDRVYLQVLEIAVANFIYSYLLFKASIVTIDPMYKEKGLPCANLGDLIKEHLISPTTETFITDPKVLLEFIRKYEHEINPDKYERDFLHSYISDFNLYFSSKIKGYVDCRKPLSDQYWVAIKQENFMRFIDKKFSSKYVTYGEDFYDSLEKEYPVTEVFKSILYCLILAKEFVKDQPKLLNTTAKADIKVRDVMSYFLFDWKQGKGMPKDLIK